jgi:hypothetical protein
MLVSVYRNGPLRNGLGKGYILVADDPARVRAATSRASGLRAALDQHRMQIQEDPRQPFGLWIDTGPVWLVSPEERARLRDALADVTAELVRAVADNGGLLLPSAAQAAARDRWSWLCEDRHSVEVSNERQREICSNLFRRWVPELIALSGRAAFGSRLAERHGSRRLADVADQVPARYIASASKLHLERVREALRRDEGVSGLEVMDINPLGDAHGQLPSVAIHCIDAQAFPATTISHALLLQALAMQARRREKEGGRIPATRAEVLDRNRSRAVAWGLSARLEQDTERPGRDPQENRRQPGTASRTAAEQIELLVRELLPELRAMEVTAAEIMPLIGGVALRGYYPDAVRTENDLFANWRRSGRRDLEGPAMHAMLGSRNMLAADQITQANTELMPGGMAVLEDYWSELLQRRDLRRGPRADGRPEGPDKRDKDGARAPRQPGRTPRENGQGRNGGPAASDGRSGADGDERQALAQATLVTALTEAPDRDAAVAAVRRHAALGWHSIVPALRQINNEDAKQIRRMLRPPGSKILRLQDSTDISGQLGKIIMETVFQAEEAFVALDIQISERAAGTRAVDAFRRSLPASVATVLVTNTSYEGGKRVSLEVLVLDMKGQG